MTYSDEEIEGAAFAAFKETFVGNASAAWKANQSSCRTIGIPAMRAALSTLTTPKATVNENLEQARYYEAELRGLSTRDTGNGSWFDDDDARTCNNAADEVAKLCAIIAGALSPTPKAWTPIGWNGPFRADYLRVVDRDEHIACIAQSIQGAAEIASALNLASGQH